MPHIPSLPHSSSTSGSTVVVCAVCGQPITHIDFKPDGESCVEPCGHPARIEVKFL